MADITRNAHFRGRAVRRLKAILVVGAPLFISTCHTNDGPCQKDPPFYLKGTKADCATQHADCRISQIDIRDTPDKVLQP